MCRHCHGSYGIFDDIFGGSRGRRGSGMGFFGYDGDIDRGTFAPVSERAMRALDSAKAHFIEHLKTVDTSKGTVSHEIIRFHLVPDMRKKFSKYVKEFGCSATSRQISRAEQDLINKSRKSLIYFTSVTITPQAQQAYFAANPTLPRPATLPAAQGAVAVPAPATAAPVASTSSSHASTPSTATNAAAGPLKDAANKIARQKLNEAAVKHAASNPTVQKLHATKKA